MSNHEKGIPSFDVYEVFSQKSPTAHFIHQFSLLAPNPEIALAMARENFLRREPCHNLWVVRREDIHMLPVEDRPYLERLGNKTYRETKGYGELVSRWRKHQERYDAWKKAEQDTGERGT